MEYCALEPPRQSLDGISLVPIFRNPKEEWARPGLTTFGENYSSVRDEQHRYIRYPDGSEELYDHQTDPYEHTNLAGQAAMKPVIESLGKAIPVRFKKSVADLIK